MDPFTVLFIVLLEVFAVIILYSIMKHKSDDKKEKLNANKPSGLSPTSSMDRDQTKKHTNKIPSSENAQEAKDMLNIPTQNCLNDTDENLQKETDKLYEKEKRETSGSVASKSCQVMKPKEKDTNENVPSKSCQVMNLKENDTNGSVPSKSCQVMNLKEKDTKGSVEFQSCLAVKPKCLIWTPGMKQQLELQINKSEYNNKSKSIIASCLLSLINDLNPGKRHGTVTSATKVKRLLNAVRKRNNQFSGYYQQDSYEMFNAIISGIEDERLNQDKEDKKENSKDITDNERIMDLCPVTRLFGGMYMTVYSYSSCNHFDIDFQRFTSICVPVPCEVLQEKSIPNDTQKDLDLSTNIYNVFDYKNPNTDMTNWGADGSEIYLMDWSNLAASKSTQEEENISKVKEANNHSPTTESKKENLVGKTCTTAKEKEEITELNAQMTPPLGNEHEIKDFGEKLKTKTSGAETSKQQDKCRKRKHLDNDDPDDPPKKKRKKCKTLTENDTKIQFAKQGNDRCPQLLKPFTEQSKIIKTIESTVQYPSDQNQQKNKCEEKCEDNGQIYGDISNMTNTALFCHSIDDAIAQKNCLKKKDEIKITKGKRYDASYNDDIKKCTKDETKTIYQHSIENTGTSNKGNDNDAFAVSTKMPTEKDEIITKDDQINTIMSQEMNDKEADIKNKTKRKNRIKRPKSEQKRKGKNQILTRKQARKLQKIIEKQKMRLLIQRNVDNHMEADLNVDRIFKSDVGDTEGTYTEKEPMDFEGQDASYLNSNKQAIKIDDDTSFFEIGNKFKEKELHLQEPIDDTCSIAVAAHRVTASGFAHFDTLTNNACAMNKIEKGLNEFTATETFSENDLPCSSCNTIGANGQCYKKLMIMLPPPVLVLQINRFKPSQYVGQLEKIQSEVSYGEILDLSPFISSAYKLVQNKAVTTKYSLYGVVCHSGSLMGGHYYAYIKTSRNNTAYLQSHFLAEKWSDPERLKDKIFDLWRNRGNTEKDDQSLSELCNMKGTDVMTAESRHTAVVDLDNPGNNGDTEKLLIENKSDEATITDSKSQTNEVGISCNSVNENLNKKDNNGDKLTNTSLQSTDKQFHWYYISDSRVVCEKNNYNALHDKRAYILMYEMVATEN
ncbi:hypothetical protein KUTeg_004628 [Tegillarca granosa]|uniref:USP domain-containing protein n=1 Tax=Tegillarca granosa TaxID=220873 RepID=A0ABQ9FM70_TEGGR|nr:hypothetical protein KUTeg_004628 [Tegillarca granosa]